MWRKEKSPQGFRMSGPGCWKQVRIPSLPICVDLTPGCAEATRSLLLPGS